MIVLDTGGILLIIVLLLSYYYVSTCGKSEPYNNLAMMVANRMGSWDTNLKYGTRTGASSANQLGADKLKSNTGSNGAESIITSELTPGDLAQAMYGLPDNIVKNSCSN